jgi:hypothetical protein
VRRRRRLESERETPGDEERPEQIGEALDVLAGVVDESVSLHEVRRVAIADVGVVDLGLQRPRFRDEERGR